MLLRVEKLSKSFGGLAAVRDLSFEVASGEILGLIGPNGAGKTTAFNLITGYYAPDRGRVTLRDHNLAGRKPHAICRLGVARTFQVVKPLPRLTVEENVLIGALHRRPRVAEAREHAAAVLERVGLAERSGHLAGSLSIGERKRLEIARALATQPTVLLLDEVLGGLHSGEIAGALDLLRGLREDGLTLVLIEHNVRAVLALCDRVCVLNHGEKLAEGRPDQIATDARVIEAYLGHGHLPAGA
jgi:branched-chain amino acid transport system ATP-binding protein